MGATLNIGGSNEKTVMEITKEILKAFGRTDDSTRWIEMVNDRQFNDAR